MRQAITDHFMLHRDASRRRRHFSLGIDAACWLAGKAVMLLAIVILVGFAIYDELDFAARRITFRRVDRVLTFAGKWLLVLIATYLIFMIWGAWCNGTLSLIVR